MFFTALATLELSAWGGGTGVEVGGVGVGDVALDTPTSRSWLPSSVTNSMYLS